MILMRYCWAKLFLFSEGNDLTDIQNTIECKFRVTIMGRIITILIILAISYFTILCSSKKTNSDDGMLALLPLETGSDGKCTVSGLGSQIRAGFTNATTTSQAVNFQEIQGTSYSVIKVADANIGTVLEISANINPDIYSSSSCPLNVQTAEYMEKGKGYSLESGSTSKISFLKKGTYLVYFQIQNRDLSISINTILSGTATTSAPVEGVGSLSFNKSCKNDGIKLCTNLYGTETTCQSGEVEDSGLCTTTNVFGICRKPVTGGYRFYSFYNGGWNTDTAKLLCTSYGGSYSSGYTAP